MILDTCILIELQRGNKDIISKVYEFEQKGIYITPVVLAEFYRGARDKSEWLKCRKLIDMFAILPLNEQVADIFIEAFDNFSLSHRPSVPDMLIAAAALYYNMPLYNKPLSIMIK